jgi:hypothetical protein
VSEGEGTRDQAGRRRYAASDVAGSSGQSPSLHAPAKSPAKFPTTPCSPCYRRRPTFPMLTSVILEAALREELRADGRAP